MSHWKKSFPGKYLQTADLDHPLDVTIATIKDACVGIGADAEDKPIAHFQEPNTKGLVLNLTKCEAIAEIAGNEDTDCWVGVRIRLSRGVTKYQGKKVGCIVVGPAPRRDDIDEAMPTAEVF